MEHKIGEGFRNGSSTQSPLLPLHTVSDNGGEAGKPPAPEEDALHHRAAGGGVGGEVELLVEKQVDGEETVFPSEVNAGEPESDDNGEESDKDDEEEEEEEEDEVRKAALEEQNVAADASEGERLKLAEGFFEVEAIRRKRICKGEPQYLIKWLGWPESANTWEPLGNLQLCPDIVEAFEKSLQSGKKTRKRKRKYTHSKKKGQYSYANSCSRDVKKPRMGRKACDNRLLFDPSRTLGSKETKDDGNSDGKEDSGRKITIQLEEAAKGDGSRVSSSSKVDGTEPTQADRRTGAKRRKSGSVQRFKPDSSSSDPSHVGNSLSVNGSYDSPEQLTVGNIDSYSDIKFDFSRESYMITQILKPIGYSTSKSNNVDDVLVTFVAMRSDGKEVMVDNKFLKARYPHVLIDFYEQHLRYSPAS